MRTADAQRPMAPISESKTGKLPKRPTLSPPEKTPPKAFWKVLPTGLGLLLPSLVLAGCVDTFLSWPINGTPFPYPEVLVAGGTAAVTLLLIATSQWVVGHPRRVRRLRRALGGTFLTLLLSAAGLQAWAEFVVDAKLKTVDWKRSTGVSKAMLDASLAMEDLDFYRHRGLDPVSMHTSLRANYRAGRVVRGGSTITQQLAKNLFLSNARTVGRKVLELPLALALERRMSKHQILELYVRTIPYGLKTKGITEAAHTYFHTTPDRLDLSQSALLAGLVPHNPDKMPELRRLTVWRNVALERLGSIYPETTVAPLKRLGIETQVYPFRIPLDRGATESVPKGWQGVLWYSYANIDPAGVFNVSPELKRRLAPFAQEIRRRYGVVAIHHLGAFADRNVRTSETHLSSHAFGDALDIAGFEFADGTRVNVIDHARPEVYARLAPIEPILRKHFDTIVDWKNEPKLHQDHYHAEVRGKRTVSQEDAH